MKFFVAIFILLSASLSAQKKFPKELKEIKFKGADKSDQPALYMPSSSSEKAPLLVALHQWSGNYKTTGYIEAVNWCIEKKWHFIQPNFRGPNETPEAMGSDFVVGDILKAVEYAKANGNVDPSRVYLMGASGGGHCTLLMAARHPEVWAAASAWVPISDIERWYSDGLKGKTDTRK